MNTNKQIEDGAKFPDAKCRHCGVPYEFFPIDVVLPNDQWMLLNGGRMEGVLCAQCIVNRAARLPHIIVVHMTLEFADAMIAARKGGV